MSRGRYEVLAKTAHGLKSERYGKLAAAQEDFDYITQTGETPSGYVSVEVWLIDGRPPADATTDTLAYWLKDNR